MPSFVIIKPDNFLVEFYVIFFYNPSFVDAFSPENLNQYGNDHSDVFVYE